MTYNLWCPEQDHRQHFDCLPERIQGRPRLDHIPTFTEAEALANTPLRALDPEAIRMAGHYAYRDIFTPDQCHFDIIPEQDPGPRWPRHWAPSAHGRTFIRFPVAGTAGYPTIKRVYRCSTHGVNPHAVSIRYSQHDRRWDQIRTQLFDRISTQRTREQIQEIIRDTVHGQGVNLDNPPWWLRQWTTYVLRRPAPVDSHAAW